MELYHRLYQKFHSKVCCKVYHFNLLCKFTYQSETSIVVKIQSKFTYKKKNQSKIQSKIFFFCLFFFYLSFTRVYLRAELKSYALDIISTTSLYENLLSYLGDFNS